MVAVNPNDLRGSHTVEQSSRRMTTHFKPTTRFSVFLLEITSTRFYWISSTRPISSRHAMRGAPAPDRVIPQELLQERSRHLYTCLPRERGQMRSGTGDKDRWAGGAAWALHPQHCSPVPRFQEDPSYNEHWPSLKVDECSVCMTHMH